jgi:oxepin-CoA hydrolase/3-oxo-5,6-dehydrosuberyl-CoA semialdehyde dehydrogenase
MVNEMKKHFLEKEFVPIVRRIDPLTPMRWGKMNAHQMVEHVSAFFKISTEKITYPLTTPLEHLPKYREFLMSEKEFRENTRAPMLPAEPLPVEYKTMDEAINDLQEQVSNFFDYFDGQPEKRSSHPAFGELNFEEWVQLHHKHVKHHLKQFGIEIPAIKASS